MLNVGIVGLGFMGMIHYLAYQRLRGVKVAAVCEQDAVRRGGDWRTIKGNFGPPGELMDLIGVAQYAELDTMLADPALDLIDICLPTALHAGAAIKALQAGKHVLCEKPIALRPVDGIAMVAAAEKAGRMLLIGHVLPFFPEYRFAYDAIAGGSTAACWAAISSGSFPTRRGCRGFTTRTSSVARCSICTFTTRTLSGSLAACPRACGAPARSAAKWSSGSMPSSASPIPAWS